MRAAFGRVFLDPFEERDISIRIEVPR